MWGVYMDKNIIMYGKNNCCNCDLMREYLNDLNINYVYMDTDIDENRKDLLRKGGVTVPVLFVNERIIKGFNPEILDEIFL